MPDEDDSEVIQEHTIKRRGIIVDNNAARRIISASIAATFVIDQLLELEILDHEQHWHAMQFVPTRKVFLRPFMISRHMMVTAYVPSPDDPPAPNTQSRTTTT